MRMIDADELIKKYGDWYTEEGTEEGYIGTVKGIVDSMPEPYTDVQTKQKTGHWIDEGQHAQMAMGYHRFRCSECGGYIFEARTDAFCKWCGSYNGGEK